MFNEIDALLDQKFLDLDDLQIIELSERVRDVEDNGLSGMYVSYHWYTVITQDDKEYDVYVK